MPSRVERISVAALLLGHLTACAGAQPEATPFDVLITNAEILDGSGAAARRGSIAIAGGKIVGVGEVNGRAARTIDASGRIVLPGLVMTHVHLCQALMRGMAASLVSCLKPN